MDFKGHFAMEGGIRCHPLTILDDHSRFSLCLAACANEQKEVVQEHLINVFKLYGLPERINTDNGSPWGCSDQGRYTELSVWLMDLGVRISYSRPRHPQTNGKLERFHRTLKQELLKTRPFHHLLHAQEEFNRWRNLYNLERPHEAIGLCAPVSKYQPSFRQYQDKIEEYEYDPTHIVKRVDLRGRVFMGGQEIFVGMPFANRNVGFCPTLQERIFHVYYRHQKLKQVAFS